MEIVYKTDVIPTADEIIVLYENAGLPRPTDDKERIRKMYEHSNVVVTAWEESRLVGVSRCITDWVWSAYLADLAVSPDHMKSGIGRKLIELTKAKVSDQSMLLLLSVPTAMDYYPKVGFAKEDRCFAIYRTK
jgi:N-acetylglutamate synthase-like GNAT family acetyltransferase